MLGVSSSIKAPYRSPFQLGNPSSSFHMLWAPILIWLFIFLPSLHQFSFIFTDSSNSLQFRCFQEDGFAQRGWMASFLKEALELLTWWWVWFTRNYVHPRSNVLPQTPWFYTRWELGFFPLLPLSLANQPVKLWAWWGCSSSLPTAKVPAGGNQHCNSSHHRYPHATPLVTLRCTADTWAVVVCWIFFRM